MKKLLLLLSLTVLNTAFSQFDITKYTEYLGSHKDMSYQKLLLEYPAGVFRDSLNYDFLKSDYGSALNSLYGLTNYERELLNRNGFMVTDRHKFINFQQAYFDIYFKDMPAYISADAILHAFHFSFDRILKKFEESLCNEEYTFLYFFNGINDKIKTLKSQSDNKSEMYLKVLKDMDLYFAVPCYLNNDSWTIEPAFAENKSLAQELISNIESLRLLDFKLFSDSVFRKIDFSQFKPRGHYTQSEILEKYFKMMIWFGRTDIYITKPGQQSNFYLPKDIDIIRQTMLAALISKVIMESGSADEPNSLLGFYEKVNSIIDSLMGYKDNLTIREIYGVMQENKITDISQLEDTVVMKDFREDLLKLNSSRQLYNSHILISNPGNPKQAETPAIFMLFGQGPTIDNFVTANVVYDRVMLNGMKVKRMLPSTLDVLFALGNDAAIQLLKNEFQQYNYSSNLAATRYLINSYDNDFWNKSYYTLWLNAIKSMNPPVERKNLPEFMQTAAWQQKNMNTQLASWIELRHDFILYTKQSYTGYIICDFPYSFVEPVPGVYENISIAMKKLKSLKDKYKTNGLEYTGFFENWIYVCENLHNISLKELKNEKLHKDDSLFLKQMMNREFSCPTYLKGWFVDLFIDNLITLNYQQGTALESRSLKNEKLTADFHTAPTDSLGNEKGYVMHGGTGPINLAIITARTPDGKLRSYAGPVMSYYETTTLGFQRLTDEEWDSLFNKGTFARPQFCNLYLADNKGNEIPGKVSLLTYVEPNGVQDCDNSGMLETTSYPNPFSESVNILVKIPLAFEGSTLKLEISDLSGSVVRTAEYSGINGGNFQLKWDGRDSRGTELQEGTYLYKISFGIYHIDGKIIKN
jgi:hypothetical protein